MLKSYIMIYIHIILSALYSLMGLLWGYWIINTDKTEIYFLSLKVNLDLCYIGLLIVGLILFLASMRNQCEQIKKLQILKLSVAINTLMIVMWSICWLDNILLLGCLGSVFFFVIYFLLYIVKCLL